MDSEYDHRLRIAETLAKLDGDLIDVADAERKLFDYMQLIHQWNQTFNLVQNAEQQHFLNRHIIDSLTLYPLLKNTSFCLDVGSGAGLPGLPLAICRPQQQWYLIDSNGKKTRFLTHVKSQLALTAVSVVQTRVESMHPPPRFQAIVLRAFADLATIFKRTHHLCEVNGRILAMKAHLSSDELQDLEIVLRNQESWKFSIHQLAGATTDNKRQVVVIQRQP